MAFLICTFASKRSEPEKISRWIAHLDELERVHGDHSDRVHTIGVLRSRAMSWLDSSRGLGGEFSTRELGSTDN